MEEDIPLSMVASLKILNALEAIQGIQALRTCRTHRTLSNSWLACHLNHMKMQNRQETNSIRFSIRIPW